MSGLRLPPASLPSRSSWLHDSATPTRQPMYKQRFSDTLSSPSTTSLQSSRRIPSRKRTMVKSSTHQQRSSGLDSIINIPELFDSILALLPFLDLVVVLGVNTTFREFILNSQRLQRKLFLLPSKPRSAREQRKHFDKKGIFSPYLGSYACLNLLAERNPSPVTLCPFLLAPSHSPRIARLSARAAEAYFWPRMYLTDPPCAHVHVNFAYGGTNKQGRYEMLEASRTIFRRGGVTLWAIEEALSQIGSIKVRLGDLIKSRRGRSKTGETRENLILHDTTVVEQVVRCQKRYKCKLSMILGATTIRLHGDPVTSEEASNSTTPLGGVKALFGLHPQKIRFED